MNRIIIACLLLMIIALLGIIALLYINILHQSQHTELLQSINIYQSHHNELLQSINNYTIDTHNLVKQATKEGIKINLEIIE